jgi:hypothetical protein
MMRVIPLLMIGDSANAEFHSNIKCKISIETVQISVM